MRDVGVRFDPCTFTGRIICDKARHASLRVGNGVETNSGEPIDVQTITDTNSFGVAERHKGQV